MSLGPSGDASERVPSGTSGHGGSDGREGVVDDAAVRLDPTLQLRRLRRLRVTRGLEARLVQRCPGPH